MGRGRFPGRSGQLLPRSGRCDQGVPRGAGPAGGSGRAAAHGGLGSVRHADRSAAGRCRGESVGRLGDFGLEGLQRFRREPGDLLSGPEAGTDLGEFAGYFAGLDAGAVRTWCGTAFRWLQRCPSPEAVPPAVPCLGRGRVARRGPWTAAVLPGTAWTTSSLRSGTGTEMPRALRICSCLRSRTLRTMPSMELSMPYRVAVRTVSAIWPNRSTRPSRCSCRVGFQARS